MRQILIVGVLMWLVACGENGPAGPSISGLTVTSEDLAGCVDQTNAYRATVGLTPLLRSSDVEAFAAAAAESDAGTRIPHNYFKTHAASGAENEILQWGAESSGGTVGGVIRNALAGMWGEGPGGGHYQNMVNSFDRVGCGVFVQGGLVTLVQEFR
jgi:hypothetical protein